jgi:hypothetical protein
MFCFVQDASMSIIYDGWIFHSVKIEIWENIKHILIYFLKNYEI